MQRIYVIFALSHLKEEVTQKQTYSKIQALDQKLKFLFSLR